MLRGTQYHTSFSPALASRNSKLSRWLLLDRMLLQFELYMPKRQD
jgi:hypothetical protein